eukprot:CAMPEP_0201909440 /NCGR_PEP_ID=MMETSP0903-20130614/1216_1 /ASSEMBLY_ACC=CAM_ASM_000552 /TAXON_ID=420261 /ORGANISM="Thalassiosira antarctica, Strain CCMP982" /LENGTH=245 /DNA_ID=CAMNT_0048443969 /DNA_START=47 /DNA_END=784 /DNA_ORIENTATION=-
MKFTLVKLSALALVAASMVSAEESQPKLRDAKKNLPELRGAIQVGAEQDVALSDESSDVSSEMPSNESSLESSFLPDEMNEEERNNDDDDDDDDDTRKSRRNRNSDNNSNSNGNGKTNAAQKRQKQRDSRRSNKNPDRTQKEEQRERERKNDQSRSRGNRCGDPGEPGCGNDNFPRNREAQRNFRCNTRGASCNHHRVKPGDEPNGRRAVRDMDCIMDCDDGRSDRARENCERTCAAKKAKLAQE